MHLHFRFTERTFGTRKHVSPQIFALMDERLVLLSILLAHCPSSSGPRSLLKTNPTPAPWCPWVHGGPWVTQEPSLRGLVLDHQVLKELELKNHSKNIVFDQI